MQSDRLPFQCWPPNGVSTEKSPTLQEYYLQQGVRNTDNIRKLTVEDLYRELCPVWKPALPGGPCLFSAENKPK